MIKRSLIMFFLMAVSTLALSDETQHESMHHKMKHGMNMKPLVEDNRISLNLSPKMKQHQLANMRAHLDAVRQIILLMAENDFNSASDMASKQLGMSKRMMKMCHRIGNETFKAMGMTFHERGDELAKTLKTGDLQASLRALNTTLTSCVGCHATFRQ